MVRLVDITLTAPPPSLATVAAWVLSCLVGLGAPAEAFAGPVPSVPVATTPVATAAPRDPAATLDATVDADEPGDDDLGAAPAGSGAAPRAVVRLVSLRRPVTDDAGSTGPVDAASDTVLPPPRARRTDGARAPPRA